MSLVQPTRFRTSYAGGVFTMPSYGIQGSNYSDVGAAFAAVDGKLTDLYSKVASGVGIPGPKGDTGAAGADGHATSTRALADCAHG